MRNTLSVLSLAAFFAAGCNDAGDAEPAVRQVDRTIAVQGPNGEPYSGQLALAVRGDTADGALALQGEEFALRYWSAAGSTLEVEDRATGATLVFDERGGAVELTFTIGGDAQVFAGEAALAGLDLPRLPQHTKLLMAAQVMDDVAGEVRGETRYYFPWLAAAIIGGVIIDACAGTELTCNGSVEVQCPDGSTVTDACGCGESTCNKCWPSTCADECTPYDPCPTVEPAPERR